MRTIRTVSELRTAVAAARGAGRRIGLVPTMGSFHAGHLALMDRAREECETVVVSLFVNPSQFGPGEDFDSYPRDERRDARLAADAGVEVLFAPSRATVYPEGFDTTVRVGGVGGELEGAQRGASHFDGVATVVTKLFNMVAPDVAYFGQKDIQQLHVIRRLVRDLDIPVEIVAVPTVRDRDGLALSSRNAYLDASERGRALALNRALAAADAAVAAGSRDADSVLAAARAELEARGVEPDYLELRSAEDFSPAAAVNGRTVLAVAARVGRARLIDNAILGGTA